MSKSRWKHFTDEQKARYVEQEKLRRQQRASIPLSAEQLQEKRERDKAARQRRAERAREESSEYRQAGRGWFVVWASSIRSRAKAKGIPFDLTAEYLQSIYTDNCPVLGIPFERRSDRNNNSPASPTVDRIVPSLGYIKGNVIIVSRRANNIKSDGKLDDLRAVLNFYEKLIGVSQN